MIKQFGGSWTEEKLDILEQYLKTYTTALKNQKFKIIYIDAFAGTGKIPLSVPEDEDAQSFLKGSVEIALGVTDKQFDKLVFIEQDSKKFKELQKTCAQSQYPYDQIELINGDSNAYLKRLRMDWRKWRGVLFLDPFATQVNWQTIETVAKLNALDTWILFPVHAIVRMLPTQQSVDAIAAPWADRLNEVYGDESWKDLYEAPLFEGLFKEEEVTERPKGVDGLISIYKRKLKNEFGNRLLDKSKRFVNSKNSTLFELFFCVGHPRGINPAKRIAGYILKNL